MTIEEIKKKRFNLKLKILQWHKSGKNAKDLVIEYHNLTQVLLDKGVNATIQADYLQLEYWDTNPANPAKPVKKAAEKIQESVSQSKSISCPIDDTGYYVLNIAWSNDLNCAQNIPPPIQCIIKGLEELGIQQIGTEIYPTDNGCDMLLKFRYVGDDDSFKLIKTFTRGLLDAFNTKGSIFGKKLRK